MMCNASKISVYDCFSLGLGSPSYVTVNEHYLLVSKCLYCSSHSTYHCFTARLAQLPLSVKARPRAWDAKHRVNPVFILTVSFDEVFSKLTYGNLVMMCLHTVISSAFHRFLGLTIVPIMSIIVNAFYSLSCCSH